MTATLFYIDRCVLEQDGSIIPSTIEAVARAEAELEDEDIELPTSLATFDDALQLASEKRSMNCAPLQIPTGSEVNLALAALEGGKIPPEVEAQMRIAAPLRRVCTCSCESLQHHYPPKLLLFY